jgi:hypothetical protein
VGRGKRWGFRKGQLGGSWGYAFTSEANRMLYDRPIPKIGSSKSRTEMAVKLMEGSSGAGFRRDLIRGTSRAKE